jgi:nicotinate-nucleotide adenylyltransferase
MSKANKPILAVYSGSFNPFHLGHLDIIQELHKNPWVSKIMVVVSPQNPGKSPSIYIQTPTERLEAVQDAVWKYKLSDKVIVSDIEFSRTPPIWTVDTLREIRAKYPDYKVVYVSGIDCLDKIRRWRNGEEILCDFGMIVFPREGYDTGKIINDTYKKHPKAILMLAVKAPMEVSSTEIRRRMTAGEDYSSLVPEKLTEEEKEEILKNLVVSDDSDIIKNKSELNDPDSVKATVDINKKMTSLEQKAKQRKGKLTEQ